MKIRKWKRLHCRLAVVVVIALIAILAVGATVQAQTGGGFDLTWNTIDGGGTLGTGGAYRLTGTIGQPDAFPALAGGAYTLIGGFWPGIPGVNLYLPLVIR